MLPINTIQALFAAPIRFRYWVLITLLSFCHLVSSQETAGAVPKVLILGDSLSAGFGLLEGEEWPALMQKRSQQEGVPFTLINASISGETTSGGLSRLPKLLQTHQPDIVMIELGANDGLRGIPLKSTKENLQAMIDLVLQKYPSVKIVLAGMQIPPNMGQEYTQEFKNLFPDLAAKNKLSLIPFLLENVGGIPSLNQADGIHPTTQGHRIIAQNVWSILEPLMIK